MNKHHRKPKAVALFSNGLDSILAVKTAIEIGIEVVAVHFTTPCSNPPPRKEHIGDFKDPRTSCRTLGVELKHIYLENDYIEIIKRPEHGSGSVMNPCIDCKILFLKKAREFMEEIGADFLITGEVVGQRPMSQTKPILRRIEKQSGCEGMILRPLCGKLLPPTKAELEGLVDRQKLLNFSGRSRQPQINLAESYGLKDYPGSAGGCLLTDPEYGKRLSDLMEYKPDFNAHDLKLLKYGRHFRYSGIKIIVGRHERDNNFIESLFDREIETMLEAVDYNSPLTIVETLTDNDVIIAAARLTARYCDGKREPEVRVQATTAGRKETIVVTPIDDEELTPLRI
jgi:tRNA-specific 2-thiouridylase